MSEPLQPTFGDLGVKLRCRAGEVAEVARGFLQPHHAGLGLGNFHERTQQAQHFVGLLDAPGEGVARGGGIGVGAREGQLGAAA